MQLWYLKNYRQFLQVVSIYFDFTRFGMGEISLPVITKHTDFEAKGLIAKVRVPFLDFL